MTYGGDIVVGQKSSFNPYCMVYGHGGLHIGNGVRIATQTVIIPANHGFDDPSTPISEQPLSKRGIVIGDDVWIGAGVRVLDGVTIADGCVIAAGAVVARSTNPGGVYVGVPARLLRQRGAPRCEDRQERHDD
jgi:acetyltransferase-like isoleucine patch superfamily enzyme